MVIEGVSEVLMWLQVPPEPRPYHAVFPDWEEPCQYSTLLEICAADYDTGSHMKAKISVFESRLDEVSEIQ